MARNSTNSDDQIDYKAECLRRDEEIRSLTDIAFSLSQQTDREQLLVEILTQVRRLTSSDGGALFILQNQQDVELDRKDPMKTKEIIFKVVQNDSVKAVEEDFSSMSIPINSDSLVGACALSQEVLNIPDVYEMGDDVSYKHDHEWDQRNNYRTRSILVVPMVGTKGETLGVIELINRKKDFSTILNSVFATASSVLDFDKSTEQFAMALASQAAVALENTNLYQNIANLFEGFIHASVSAIETLDPTTSGHSFRVATMTVELAKATSDTSEGKYKSLALTPQSLKEIEYASLLHDFGKMVVPTEVLVKAKKLFPKDYNALMDRVQLLKTEMRLLASEKKFKLLEGGQSYSHIDEELAASLNDIDHLETLIIKSNEPTILEEGDFKSLEVFKGRFLQTHDGREVGYLGDDEFLSLSLKRGTLTSEQRVQIETHVSATFDFLSTIPWTQELNMVADIAHGHHEKLSGRGYPLGLKGDEIPVQSRMMTIADIFDALTARDRPYKRAVPLEKSLDILQSEVDRGDLDAGLFDIFKERKIYKHIEV
jgi:HD-GYP domain-containing protein (c-di-GMP phosphodiesterase class II)